LFLYFSNGAAAPSAMGIADDTSYRKGIAAYFSTREILDYDLMMISGEKYGYGHLKVDSQGSVSTPSRCDDVLLRKRAL
jgi:hypothetical protein